MQIRKLEILFLMLLLLAGCHKKEKANPVAVPVPVPSPVPEKVEMKKVEDLCETGTIDDLFTKNCTTDQKMRFIRRTYEASFCNKVYEYIADYDDIDLYNVLAKDKKFYSASYFKQRPDLFVERCYDKKSDRVGRRFFQDNARLLVDEDKISQKMINIYNCYIDLGANIEPENTIDRSNFDSSVAYYFLEKVQVKEPNLKKQYHNLLRKIIRQSEYFFPLTKTENRLDINEIRDLIKKLCHLRRFIPVTELLNILGPQVSTNVFINPFKYFKCLSDPGSLNALLRGFSEKQITFLGFKTKFLSATLRSNLRYVYKIFPARFYEDKTIPLADDLEVNDEKYLNKEIMEILFNYFDIKDFFVRDNLDSQNPPFYYVNLRILKSLIVKMAKEKDGLKNLKKSVENYYGEGAEYQVQHKAIVKFIENQEEGLLFVNEEIDHEFYYGAE